MLFDQRLHFASLFRRMGDALSLPAPSLTNSPLPLLLLTPFSSTCFPPAFLRLMPKPNAAALSAFNCSRSLQQDLWRRRGLVRGEEGKGREAGRLGRVGGELGQFAVALIFPLHFHAATFIKRWKWLEEMAAQAPPLPRPLAPSPSSSSQSESGWQFYADHMSMSCDWCWQP